MRILVTGAAGQLGRSLERESAFSADEYVFKDVDLLDITDPQAVEREMEEGGYGAVVNCAAYTDVERAESDHDRAELLNGVAPGIIADACRRHDALLVHVSTDYVFGGNVCNTPCREDEPENPTGVYGLTKLHGEQAVRDSGCRHLILRTAWLYSEYGKNFVKTMRALTSTRPEVKVVFDQTGTPTYAGDLAEAIVYILSGRRDRGNEGTYHFSDEGVCSWYDFALQTARLSGNVECRVVPCHSAEFPSEVRRPAYSVLDKTLFKTVFRCEIPHWTDSLRKCVENLEREGDAGNR